MGEQRAHVLVQLLADFEAVVQFGDEVVLLGRECVGIIGINGGEVAARELILLAVDRDGALLVVDGLEQLAVLHLPLRMALVELALQLEL